MPELTWSGKKLTQNEPASLIQDSVIYPQGCGYPGGAPLGRLLLGDNLSVMTALLPEFEGRIDLIYADPPFFTNRKFPSQLVNVKFLGIYSIAALFMVILPSMLASAES